MKKNQAGITLITLVVTIIIMIIIAGITLHFSRKLIKETELKNSVTNMLLIQARAEVIYDKNKFDSENNPLIGKQVTTELIGTEISNDLANAYFEKIDENWNEEDIKKWYIWDNTSAIDELNNLKINLKDGFYYIVNYETGEILSSKGYSQDGDIVYTLSEMKYLSENK